MSKICSGCGNELKDSAKFCGKCGSEANELRQRSSCGSCGHKLEEDEQFCSRCGSEVQKTVQETVCKNCGYEIKEGGDFCSRCGTKVGIMPQDIKCKNCGQELKEEAIFCHKCGEPRKGNTQDNVAKSVKQGKDKAEEYANAAKSKGKDFINDVKSYKSLSNKKKRNVIIGLAGVVAVFAIVLMLITQVFSPGVSKKVVAEAALKIAEQDYGYTLTMVDYDIVDSFTAKGDNLMSGKTVKAKMYLVVIEAEAKTDDGEVVETVKYGISVVDPEKKGDYVAYSPMSQGENCSGMENKDIVELLKEGTARLH